MKLCLLSETQTVSACHKGTLESFLSKNRGLPRSLCEALTLHMHSSCVVQKCAFARSIETHVVQKCAFAHERVKGHQCYRCVVKYVHKVTVKLEYIILRCSCWRITHYTAKGKREVYNLPIWYLHVHVGGVPSLVFG